jgi:drug/metabolite transporter (DMT)-like permease
MATISGVIAILMWGMLAVLSVYSASFPPFQLLFVCFSVSSIIVIIKRYIKREQVWRLPSLTTQQWIFATGGLFGFHFCYFMAVRFAPPIEASLIAYLWPLMLGVAVATRWQRQFAVVGGGLGFLGCAVLVTGGKAIAFNSDYILGYAFALFCAFIWTGYSWFMSQTKSEVEDIGWISAVVALLALVAHLSLEDSYWQFSWQAWLSALLLGLGPVGGAFYLWDVGLKFGNKPLLASLSFTTPVISSLALYLCGLSVLSNEVTIALGLIVAGALISNALPAIWARYKISYNQI